ncbi:hypothetical protein Nepgr_022760 [Nepenthes gracilis]|uniref:Secreted protein n=1 Tax=Nepenthes gracilis TaxID=150966 RepID=A0AAD3T0W7_NEPGR|nr:hypothetical protein Nepgr_022760 [Nepenthes gracilis]
MPFKSFFTSLLGLFSCCNGGGPCVGSSLSSSLSFRRIVLIGVAWWSGASAPREEKVASSPSHQGRYGHSICGPCWRVSACLRRSFMSLPQVHAVIAAMGQE